MSSPWQQPWFRTDLSVGDPPYREVGAKGRESFDFDVDEVPASVAAELRDVGNGDVVTDGVVVQPFTTDTVTITRSADLEPLHTYIIVATFSRSDGYTWYATYNLVCVA